MCEQEHNRVLRDAARRFPDGCLCEDCGMCAYCSFILSRLDERNRTCGSLSEESGDRALLDRMRFKIPIGSFAQIYGLRRVFELCVLATITMDVLSVTAIAQAPPISHETVIGVPMWE